MISLFRACILGLLIYLLGGCAVELESKNLVVRHQVDVANLMKYFEARCKEEHPTYNGIQITACANAEVADFLTSFGEN
jgi:hypothetical protein